MQIDSTPMVCITGQVGKHLLGSDAFQKPILLEFQLQWPNGITKLPKSEIPEIMAKAFMPDQDT
jgi:acetolactate synthase-1/2/3 large subunit